MTEAEADELKPGAKVWRIESWPAQGWFAIRVDAIGRRPPDQSHDVDGRRLYAMTASLWKKGAPAADLFLTRDDAQAEARRRVCVALRAQIKKATARLKKLERLLNV
jgi:hypothetical protein